jgi:uncharacterized protein YdcH (DUF465 family)
MYGARHHLTNEFPEYQHAIDLLKSRSNDFAQLLDEYDATDKQIYGYTQQSTPISDTHMEVLKKKRLRLKDQLYQILKRYKKPGQG